MVEPPACVGLDLATRLIRITPSRSRGAVAAYCDQLRSPRACLKASSASRDVTFFMASTMDQALARAKLTTNSTSGAAATRPSRVMSMNSLRQAQVIQGLARQLRRNLASAAPRVARGRHD